MKLEIQQKVISVKFKSPTFLHTTTTSTNFVQQPYQYIPPARQEHNNISSAHMTPTPTVNNGRETFYMNQLRSPNSTDDSYLAAHCYHHSNNGNHIRGNVQETISKLFLL